MTHDERVRHHMYDTLEGIAEQSERIASLEELVLELYDIADLAEKPVGWWRDFERRMQELEVVR